MCPVGLLVLQLCSLLRRNIIISCHSGTISVFIFSHPTLGTCHITKTRNNLNWCHVGVPGCRQINHPEFHLLTSTSFLLFWKSALSLFLCNAQGQGSDPVYLINILSNRDIRSRNYCVGKLMIHDFQVKCIEPLIPVTTKTCTRLIMRKCFWQSTFNDEEWILIEPPWLRQLCIRFLSLVFIVSHWNSYALSWHKIQTSWNFRHISL